MKVKIPYKMNAVQRKAMLEEISDQLIKKDEEYSMEVDAMILYLLHIFPDTKFGKKKLRRFWNLIFQEHQRLRDQYQLSTNDSGWLYCYLLKEHTGIDIEQWYKEQKGGEQSVARQ